MCAATPSRNIRAAASNPAGVRCLVASPMNAVLQDSAKACCRSLTFPSLSALRNTSPCTVAVGGQLAADDGVSPRASSAAEVITLNAEPGGYAPWNATSKPPALTSAAASTAPVLALTATSAAVRLPSAVSEASAASAARCAAGSIVVVTGVPGRGGIDATVVTVVPGPLTTTTRAAGVPASCCSATPSRPVWPITLSASYGLPSWPSSCAVIGPVVPTTPATRPGVIAVRCCTCWNTVPGSG